MSKAESERVFVDGVTSLRMVGGVVRIDFGEIEGKGDNENPETPTFTDVLRVYMPLEGFVRAHGAMQRIIDKMQADGVVKKVVREDVG